MCCGLTMAGACAKHQPCYWSQMVSPLDGWPQVDNHHQELMNEISYTQGHVKQVVACANLTVESGKEANTIMKQSLEELKKANKNLTCVNENLTGLTGEARKSNKWIRKLWPVVKESREQTELMKLHLKMKEVGIECVNSTLQEWRSSQAHDDSTR